MIEAESRWLRVAFGRIREREDKEKELVFG